MSFATNIKAAGKAALFYGKKYSPEILLGVGIVTGVATVIFASKATLKLDEILDDSRDKMNRIRAAHEAGEVVIDEASGEVVDYTEADYRNDCTIVYSKTGLALVKTYGPALVCGAVSLASFLASHKIIKGRNAALVTAYGALEGVFKDYRNNVIEELGKDADERFRYGLKTDTIETITVDEDGKKHKTKETVTYIPEERKEYSKWAREFREYNRIDGTGSKEWERSSEYNNAFIKTQERYFNDLVKANGYIWANDIYKALGFPEDEDGWEFGIAKDDREGDNYVDLRMVNTRRRVKITEAGGNIAYRFEDVIIIDPNVSYIKKLVFKKQPVKEYPNKDLPF